MIQWMKQTDAPDRHAREIRFIVVPRPADFWERAVLDGSPPKVIRVRFGNCTTDDVRTLLSEQA